MPLRSPCHTCDHSKGNKDTFPQCQACELRFEYVAELEGWDKDKLDEVRAKLLTDLKRRKARYCDTPGCKELHHAKGKCRVCYDKLLYENRRLSKKGGKISPYFFLNLSRFEDGITTIQLVKAIAKYEHRFVTAQLLEFIQMGVIQWLRDHNMEE